MKLSIKERLDLLSMLPITGNMKAVRLINEVKKKLNLNESEIVECGLIRYQIATCNICGTKMHISDSNINPETGKHHCQHCNSSDYVDTGEQLYNWNMEAERDFDIKFTSEEKGLIADSLDQVEKKGLVKIDQIQLFEKFLEI